MKNFEVEYEYWKRENTLYGRADSPHERDTSTFKATDLSECYRLVWADGAKRFGLGKDCKWRVVSCREMEGAG